MHEYVIRKTSDLIPYVNNSRTHSDQQIKQIAASIKEFGFTNPILIDESNGVIAGHGRIEAAGKLGMDEVPCIVLDGLTDAQKKAYVIADNQLALNAGWNEDLLKLEIEGLKELEFDIDLLGFDDDFIINPEDVNFPDLGDGSDSGVMSITFTVTDEQKEDIDRAIKAIQQNEDYQTPYNENKNGNALAFLACTYVG